MKVGLGLYRKSLTAENFAFARQIGVTHIVAHLVDYFADTRLPDQRESKYGWGLTENEGKLWTLDELKELKNTVNAHGLQLAAIENFDPSHWYDILLGGPHRDQQLEDIKALIRRLGQAGIPVMGYSFSLANVWGHVTGPFARGGAETVGFFGPDGPAETPIPQGNVWNMTYDKNAPQGTIGDVSEDEMWKRLSAFLREVVPVAEESGVRLAMHPADPPVPVLRHTGRLAYRPEQLQRVLDIVPSRSNALEFCQGTIAEMPDTDIYDVIDHFSRQGSIAYVHFRNVRGKAPHYEEVFVDEGDVDMQKALSIYVRNGYDGVVIPDHTPRLTCDAPWHAGMAYAVGYIRATLQSLGGLEK
jgi:mannonate dehydratase